MPSIAILGITGRMGQAVALALKDAPRLRLSGAAASATSAGLGRDAILAGEPCGLTITADVDEALRGASVAVDFSAAAAVALHAQACAARAIPLLIGTTGYDAAAREAIERAGRHIAVLVAPNTSVGVTVAVTLAAAAAAALGGGYEVDIHEVHHRHKQDAPSGTALALGEAVARARGQLLAEAADYGRAAGGVRPAGSIGFISVREGDVVGEHTVSFTGTAERLEITHRAMDRSSFARGALRGAEWLLGRAAGVYGMRDVLGL